ncbi:PREDICTED: olfactory receptor 11L1-like [Nanorana parkeri]|uniref:olfactory receptor 11L1-like n=1 Tax=Nanorana parkeri TaxID=125878 RepID=UPI000854497C|nr:PREDICTED: olfactory receptor 11L1-like [Nanorana parkeri]
MFYFLKHLSISEILFTANITPNMLHVLLRNGSVMSLAGCIIQFYVYIASGSVESVLLTILSYDRYMAICNPLRYAEIMNLQLCRTLVSVSCFLCFTVVLTTVILLCQLDFCGPDIIDHFFCDFDPLVDLSCSDTSVVRTEVVILSVPVVASTFSFIIWTYMYIFITIFRISSSAGRQKAFSTCSSHLASVCSYYGPLIVIYMVPYRRNSFNTNKFLSILYTVLTPLFNPLIYSLRNEELCLVLWKLLRLNTTA